MCGVVPVLRSFDKELRQLEGRNQAQQLSSRADLVMDKGCADSSCIKNATVGMHARPLKGDR